MTFMAKLAVTLVIVSSLALILDAIIEGVLFDRKPGLITYICIAILVSAGTAFATLELYIMWSE